MFNLADYEPVEVRLQRFIKDWPDFRISTELESHQHDRFIVKAYLYKHLEDAVAFTTGYAEEKVSDRGVNSTSALENCETSAIGRALANAGYSAKGKRPSQEEMAKVNRAVERPELAKTSAPTNPEQFTPSNATIEPDAVDYWATPFGDGSHLHLVPAPAAIAQTIQNSPIGITTKVVPNCVHGEMIWHEGQKNGKAWARYKCMLSGHAGTEGECPPIWYNLSKDGTWSPQKARV